MMYSFLHEPTVCDVMQHSCRSFLMDAKFHWSQSKSLFNLCLGFLLKSQCNYCNTIAVASVLMQTKWSCLCKRPGIALHHIAHGCKEDKSVSHKLAKNAFYTGIKHAKNATDSRIIRKFISN